MIQRQKRKKNLSQIGFRLLNSEIGNDRFEVYRKGP